MATIATQCSCGRSLSDYYLYYTAVVKQLTKQHLEEVYAKDGTKVRLKDVSNIFEYSRTENLNVKAVLDSLHFDNLCCRTKMLTSIKPSDLLLNDPGVYVDQ